MSLVTPPSAPPASRPTSPTVRSTWRAWRMVALIGVVTVLVSVIALLVRPGGGPSRPLDPDDTTLAGSKALAELLRARGVTVDRVDSVQAAADKASTGHRLLLITDTTYFNEFRLSTIPGDRLIVGNVFGLRALAPGLRRVPEPARTRLRDPECGLPAATAAGSAYMGGMAFRGPPGATGCYPAGDGHTLISFPNAGGTTTVVGDGSFLTNQRLAEDGNAALAINLIGTGRPVTWLVRPDNPPQGESALGESRRSMYDLMPAGIAWALYMSVIALVLTAFWRGRRLGPVVTEKLPVVVRAAETVEGRGRLYRARRARQRAADSLRAGTIDRLTPRLGLGSGAGAHEVVAALAARTGQDPQQVGAALYGAPPVDDAGLVGLAGYLDFIERQVSEL
ncbi:DUF4350 domain-containing protein [Nonomuraea jiangxiensis]|uniref:DUF4350 domain-containing protein n=1 Tax=Nonomuraea jiangxiensis TaxID=633440 RepID=A0A1G8F3H5_9ACTN|nr:DUF4350 domain-containing protein [Nonomuraea jiangxiensis]SDH76569.1 hypothetical protein SAMN05421869_103192 [Nonomuraea jiangxiensis]